jgi:hypothetical protein
MTAWASSSAPALHCTRHRRPPISSARSYLQCSASGRSTGTPSLVFPGKLGYAARRIEDEGDVQDVIALLRLNYDRAVARHGFPSSAPA